MSKCAFSNHSLIAHFIITVLALTCAGCDSSGPEEKDQHESYFLSEQTLEEVAAEERIRIEAFGFPILVEGERVENRQFVFNFINRLSDEETTRYLLEFTITDSTSLRMLAETTPADSAALRYFVNWRDKKETLAKDFAESDRREAHVDLSSLVSRGDSLSVHFRRVYPDVSVDLFSTRYDFVVGSTGKATPRSAYVVGPDEKVPLPVWQEADKDSRRQLLQQLQRQ